MQTCPCSAQTCRIVHGQHFLTGVGHSGPVRSQQPVIRHPYTFSPFVPPLSFVCPGCIGSYEAWWHLHYTMRKSGYKGNPAVLMMWYLHRLRGDPVIQFYPNGISLKGFRSGMDGLRIPCRQRVLISPRPPMLSQAPALLAPDGFSSSWSLSGPASTDGQVSVRGCPDFILSKSRESISSSLSVSVPRRYRFHRFASASIFLLQLHISCQCIPEKLKPPCR